MAHRARSHMVPRSFSLLLPKMLPAVAPTLMTQQVCARRKCRYQVFVQVQTRLPHVGRLRSPRGNAGQMLMMMMAMSGGQCGFLPHSQICASSRSHLICIQAGRWNLARQVSKRSAMSKQQRQPEQNVPCSLVLFLRACCVRPRCPMCMRTDSLQLCFSLIWLMLSGVVLWRRDDGRSFRCFVFVPVHVAGGS